MASPALTIEEFLYQAARGHENKQRPMIIGATLLLATSTLVVTLRLWARRIQGLRLAWSDYTILLSLVLAYYAW